MKSFLLSFLLSIMFLSGCYPSVHINLSKEMAPCPDSPNCVSSLSDNPRHSIDPFSVYISGRESFILLNDIVKAMRGSESLWRSDLALAAIFTTRLGFVDDVQFLLDEKARVIHVRSASRVGYWDLGVNRKRIEAIRREYLSRIETLGQSPTPKLQ
jgi:uncharacterized protein (DUF1499 family)